LKSNRQSPITIAIQSAIASVIKS